MEAAPTAPISHSKRQRLFGRLQAIGNFAQTGNLQEAMRIVDKSIRAFPEEPVVHLRRADLFVQHPALFRLGCGMNIHRELSRTLDGLEACADRPAILPLGHRERRYFGNLQSFCEGQYWLDLQTRTLAVAELYFPNVNLSDLNSPGIDATPFMSTALPRPVFDNNKASTPHPRAPK